MPSLVQKLVAEWFGTFVLVFAGTGAIVVNDRTGGGVGHIGVAMVFGLIVMAMIYAIGDVSGCHLNPAVTLGFCTAGRFPPRLVGPYIAAQVAGAIVASGVVWFLFPESTTLGGTNPAGSVLQSVVLETILTMILMVVILSVSAGSKEAGMMAGVAIGAVVTLEALFAGGVSGASMNPARSLGPALVSGRLDALPIYLIAPVLGAQLAVVIERSLRSQTPAGE